MNIVFNLILLIICFALLIKGADFLVDAASYIAKALKIPALVIGLTIVAFGTSCPEAGVSIVSSLNGANSLSISNVVGSNAFNLLVVVGISAMLGSIAVDKDLLKFDFPICIAATAAMTALCFTRQISRIAGFIFVAAIITYVVFLVIRSLKDKEKIQEAEKEASKGPIKFSSKGIFIRVLVLIICVAVIYLASKGIVVSCTFFAKLFGISDTIIGLTIVALGTSLPELVTSLVAHKKGENSIALGNIVGSNLFNILFVLGTAAAISPVDLVKDNIIDGVICLVITVFCYILSVTKKEISKLEGASMLSVYALYMVYVFLREFGILF